MPQKLNVVIVGAHPDDCEFHAGGTAIRYIESGHNVTFVSTTCGDTGHHQLDRDAIRRRRYKETKAVADYLGIEYIVLDNPDCGLEPTVNVRQQLIGVLRRLQPDLVITHGLREYHPDHRYTAQVISDTAYVLNVPLCVPEAPVAVNKDVVYCHISYKPPVDKTLVVMVPVDDYIDKKLISLSFHESQFFEWLPWIEKTANPSDIPTDEDGRLNFLRKRYLPKWEQIRLNYLPKIREEIGETQIQYVEAFEVCPWGTNLDFESARRYFPFEDVIII